MKTYFCCVTYRKVAQYGLYSLNLIIIWAKSQSRGNRELKYKQGWKMRNETERKRGQRKNKKKGKNLK